MEKNHRLFVRNLPPDVDNNDLEKLFNEYGTITNVDIKDKIQNDGSKIAFVNLATTEAKLNACFRAANTASVRGSSINVQVAKESFLDRLKREREEAASVKTRVQPALPQNLPIERINIEIPKAVKCKPTKRIYHFDDAEDFDSAEQRDDKSDVDGSFAHDPALRVEASPIEKPSKVQEPKFVKSHENVVEKTEKKILCASEIKRLASLRQKKQTFRSNEKLISQALKAVDTVNRNKRIVFSEDIEDTNFAGKKSKSLFDDDENSEDQGDWEAEEFQHDEKRNAKLKMSLNNVGRDKRFIIDERFIDDDGRTKETTEDGENDDDSKNETKWQLDILEDVLGKPFKARNENFGGKKQNKMIRYDPTSNDHRDHEIITKMPVVKAKKVRLNKSIVEEEVTPLPVSSAVFYAVSDNLTEALKPQEEFSLLKSFGTPRTIDKNKSDEYETTVKEYQEQKWEGKADNPFKYESSDDEAPYPSMDKVACKSVVSDKSTIIDGNDTFFFGIDDGRFNEAELFYNTRPTTSDNFTNVRRGLKQIVRSKIRNNVRKNTPWRNSKQIQRKIR